MKYYKPNNATIMYLNSSYNCIKNSSITLTLTSAGTGYTAPTVVITPAAGDSGTGCTATIQQTGGVLNTLVITNNGSNYNKLPTITITGGGTGGVITPSFLRTYTYTWNGIPPLVINDLAKLSAINIIATGFTSSTPYTYRILGLQYDSRDSFFSDYGQPILSMAQNTNVCSYGSLGGGEFCIILTPQTVNSITISVDDDITKIGSGQLASINFVIAIEIEEYDPVITRTDDVYAEATSRLKHMF